MVGIGELRCGYRPVGVEPVALDDAQRKPIGDFAVGVCAVSLLFIVRGRHPLQLDDLVGGDQYMARTNQTLYNFWFYITNFSRYPMEIYQSFYPLQWVFTFIIPVLIVVNVPARMMAMPLTNQWGLPVFAIVATVLSLLASRVVFKLALKSYRSASS